MPSELDDRTCLVTGATSGHGRALALALARRGASVVLLGRNADRCRAVQEELERETGRAPRVLRCDLASRREIDRAAEEFRSWNVPLHLLVNNAGLVMKDRRETVDGVETTVAVNYLAAFQLTLRLLPVLRASAPARIVMVASDAHHLARRELPDLESRSFYWFMGSYANSKLALLYFTRELARRLSGTGVTVNACDPGPVASGIADHEPGALVAVARWAIRRFFPAPERAARTALHLAASPEVEGLTGSYWRFLKPKEPPLARDEAAVARRLWAWSAARAGVDLEP